MALLNNMGQGEANLFGIRSNQPVSIRRYQAMRALNVALHASGARSTRHQIHFQQVDKVDLMATAECIASLACLSPCGFARSCIAPASARTLLNIYGRDIFSGLAAKRERTRLFRCWRAVAGTFASLMRWTNLVNKCSASSPMGEALCTKPATNTRHVS